MAGLVFNKSIVLVLPNKVSIPVCMMPLSPALLKEQNGFQQTIILYSVRQDISGYNAGTTFRVQRDNNIFFNALDSVNSS